ncbi:hypothetical protein FJR09_18775 [Dolichospermum sp. UHCC 0406]|nr:hypothetical protein [Dolichospermum sp. UHCC 0406]
MSIHFILAFTLFCWVVLHLARHSLITPYIAGGAAMTLCSFFQTKAEVFLAATVLAYFIVYLLNEDVDPSQLLVRDRESAATLTEEIGGNIKIVRIVTLLLFCFLPIPSPPGFVTGVFPVVIISLLIFLNKDKGGGNLIGYVVLVVMAVGGATLALWLVKTFLQVQVSVIPILTGLAIPSLLGCDPPPTKSLRERGLNSPPGINNILWTFLLTWVTPGLSLSATTSALIAPGAYRLIIANLTSVAIEGWNLGLLFRDGSSTKTPLADLLLRPDRWYQTPTLQVSGAGLDYLVFVVLLGVLPAIAMYLWCNSRFEPDPGVIILVMLVQSVVLAGWSALILVPLGLFFAVLQIAFMPNYSEIRSLTIMAPKLVP